MESHDHQQPEHLIGDSSATSNSGCFIFATIGIIIGCIVYAGWHWLPIVSTIVLALQEWDLLRSPKFVGLDNYLRLFAEPLFWSAFIQTVALSISRVIALSIVWAVLLVSWPQRHRIPLLAVMLALFALPFASPTTSWSVWNYHIASPSGLLRPLFVSLIDTYGPTISVLAFDFLQTLALASGLGLLIYALADNGRGYTPNNDAQSNIVLRVTWLVGVLVGFATGVQSFTLAALEGNANSLVHLSYQNSFQFFRFGYGAAIDSVMIVPVIIMAVIVGIALIRTPLTLCSTSRQEMRPSETAPFGIGLLILSLLPILIILLPLVLAVAGENNTLLWAMVPLATWNFNTILASINGVWVFTLPFITGVGICMAWVYASGRRRVYWLLLPFTISAVIGFSLVTKPMFTIVRNLGWLNTNLSLQFLGTDGSVGLLLISLLFVGLLRDYRNAASGYTASDNATSDNTRTTDREKTSITQNQVIITMILLYLVIGMSATIHMMDQLMAPLLFLNSMERFTLTLGQVAIQNQSPDLAHVATQPGLILDLLSALGMTLFGFFLLRRTALVRTNPSKIM